jgi:hypothetical protein
MGCTAEDVLEPLAEELCVNENLRALVVGLVGGVNDSEVIDEIVRNQSRGISRSIDQFVRSPERLPASYRGFST